MNLYLANNDEFIEHLTKIILDNLQNENFGVTDFVKLSGLNRNYLSRRIKSIKKITINQFIVEVRLEKARDLLLEGTYTAAEVSYDVGFNSPAYFNKCFHEHFGYPPGDIKKGTVDITTSMVSENEPVNNSNSKDSSKQWLKSKKIKIISATASVVLLAGIIFLSVYFVQNTSVDKQKSIAVLPFKNLSENEENRYFADGVVEDILDRLAKISELHVVSRTSVEQFRESLESAPEIGKKLGVNYLLEGSVQRHKEKVRITIQLIDAKNDRHILSEKIDRDMKDIFELESDIAKLVADKLQAAISPEEKQLIEKIHTRNSEAYDYYLMGRYYWNLRTKASYKKSIEYFEKAINTDSTYALAYAGLADAYYLLGWKVLNPTKYVDKAVKLANKALQIDKNLPEAYAVLGIVYAKVFWQWEESEKYFKKAMELDSNNIVTLYYYSSLLGVVGDFDTSRKYINRAIEFAPYSARFRRISCALYYDENKPKEALQEMLVVEGMLGEHSDQQEIVFISYLSAGDTVSALQYLQRNFATNPKYKQYKAFADQVFPVFQSSGLKGILQMMVDKPPNCWWAVQMDSLDLAIHYLEILYKNRHPITIAHILDPNSKKLHNDPRFLEIADKTGLTPYFNLRYKN
jgi:TolB-like protein/AraC-like DNA-binding protein/TPR repeat protein